jgi:hypothetical protein
MKLRFVSGITNLICTYRLGYWTVLLALVLTLGTNLRAQTVTYPLPGPSWPSGFAPQVPTTLTQTYTYSGNCPGDTNFTQVSQTAENVYPPFWYQRPYTPYGSAAYGGFYF